MSISENCDIALGVFGEAELGRSVVRNKLIESLSLRIPVVNQFPKAFKEFNLETEGIVIVADSQSETIVPVLSICQHRSKELLTIQNMQMSLGVFIFLTLSLINLNRE